MVQQLKSLNNQLSAIAAFHKDVAPFIGKIAFRTDRAGILRMILIGIIFSRFLR
jgi:hypothetical protein